MTAKELIKKHKIFLAGDDKIGVPRLNKLPAKVVEQIKTMKPEIIAVLKAEKAAEEARKAEDKARFDADVAAFRSGEKRIAVQLYHGEILSGYTVYDRAALAVLREAGIGREVSGWGWLVPDEIVEALGTEFSLADAKAFIDARRPKKTDLNEVREQKIAEAARTGQPVEIRRWTEPCSDPREECSLDIVIEWALPDDTTKIERRHTW